MSETTIVDVAVRRGDFDLTAALTLEAGNRLAILGANGAGKSTLLSAIAGLLTPERGRILVAGTPVFERHAGERPVRNVPTARRRVGLLGQDPLLFPHLSALNNVAFGPRAHHVPRAQAADEATRLLTAVGLHSVERRKPHQLSGGQQQRVALARALAARPQLLLLDEPFASMDVQAASHMRTLVADTLREQGMTAMMVTHNVLDAIALADRCLVLHEGRVVDEGPTARVLENPRNALAAALTGTCLVQGPLAGDGGPGVEASVAGVLLHPRDARGFAPGTQVRLVFAPRDADLLHPQAGPNAGLTHRVATLEPTGDGVRVRFAGSESLQVEVGAEAALRLSLREGLDCQVRIREGAARVSPVS